MTGTPGPLVLPPDELARLRAVAAGGAREVRRAIAEAVNAERARAEAAEAKLTEVRAALLEGGQDDGTVRRRALAIIGSEPREEATYDRDFDGSVL